MPFVKANGLDFHVQEMNKGAGETVVLIHGMFANLSMYYFRIAPKLAERYHVVMYDYRSHGMSPKASSGFDLITLSEDLSGILDALNVKNYHLGGYSYGALLALKMATRFPERVKKLIAIDAPDPAKTDLLEQPFDSESQDSFDTLIEYMHTDQQKTKSIFGKRRLEKYRKNYAQFINDSTVKEDMYQQRHFFEKGEVDSIKNKTLLLYGSSSDCIHACTRLNNMITNSSVTFIDGDHRAPLVNPHEVALSIETFLLN
ncbi:MAG: alpha/beta hydrolase [Bacteroidota bacterium]